MRKPRLSAAALAAALALLGTEAQAQTAGAKPDQPAGARLKQVEKALAGEEARARQLRAESKALSDELRALRRKSIAAARRTQLLERNLSAVEDRLAALRDARNAAEAKLAANRRQTAALLAALQRMARRPPTLAVLTEPTPGQAARTALLLRTALPAVETRAAKLNAALQEIEGLTREIAAKGSAQKDALELLTAEREALDLMIARKAGLEAQRNAAGKQATARTARLAREAGSLRELMARLAPSPPVPLARPTPQAESGSPRTQDRAGLPGGARPALPAMGRVVEQFGALNSGGRRTEGIRIATRPGARVIAPVAGDVAFAGPFRGYGRLLIIRQTGGYHTLLAGFGRIDVTTGQALSAGEPVGVMARADAPSPILYIEVRRDGRPINPLPYLAASAPGVSG